MRPRTSEFSYGFALTRELIDKRWKGLQPTSAPYLPSLWAEGQQGFDVRLKGIPSRTSEVGITDPKKAGRSKSSGDFLDGPCDNVRDHCRRCV